MKKDQTGFGLAIGLVVFACISLVGLANWYVWNTGQAKKHPSEKNTQVPDPNAEWPKYTSSGGDFSVQYPPGWFAKFSRPVDSKDMQALQGVTLSLNENNESRIVFVNEYITVLSLRQIAASKSAQARIIEEKDTVIDGNHTYFISTEGPGDSKRKSYYIENKKAVVEITFLEKGSSLPSLEPYDNSAYATQFEKIANSFQFH